MNGTGGAGGTGGSCGVCIPPANGSAMCVQTVCQKICPPGRHLVVASNSCDLDTSACCGQNCTPCAASRANSMATCTTGACVMPSPCSLGFHDCSGTCVADDSILGCGTTTCAVCAAPTGGTAACVGGVCQKICAPLTLCGNACVNTQTDPLHCGTTCTPCVARANQTSLCTNGTCSFPCNSGFGDCNGVSTDGCEVDLTTNDLNCGRCNLLMSIMTSDANNQTPWCTALRPDPTAGNALKNFACKLWTQERCVGSLCLHCVTALDSNLDACCQNSDVLVNPVFPACCEDPVNPTLRKVCNSCQEVADLADCPCPTELDFNTSQCCVDTASPKRYRYCASPTPCSPPP